MIKQKHLAIVVVCITILTAAVIAGCSCSANTSSETSSSSETEDIVEVIDESASAEDEMSESDDEETNKLKGFWSMAGYNLDEEAIAEKYSDEKEYKSAMWDEQDAVKSIMLAGAYVEFKSGGNYSYYEGKYDSDNQVYRIEKVTDGTYTENEDGTYTMKSGDEVITAALSEDDGVITMTEDKWLMPRMFNKVEISIEEIEDKPVGSKMSFTSHANYCRAEETEAVKAITVDGNKVHVELDTNLLTKKFDEDKPYVVVDPWGDYSDGIAMKVTKLEKNGDIWVYDGEFVEMSELALNSLD